MNAQEQKQVKVQVTLSSDQYKRLEQQALQGLSLREDTSAIQAGYMLGVGAVLRLIREGFTAS